MRYVSRCVVLLVASLGLFSASADVVTFLDGTDNISVSHTGNQRIFLPFNPILSCGALTETEFNSCSVTVVTLAGPSGLLPVPTSPAMTLSILEPNSNVLSDTLQLSPNVIFNSYDLKFTSDAEGGTSLGTPGTPSIVENGAVQFAFNVNWSDGTSDQIFFQSDLEAPVPEPSSLAFLGGGLLMLSGFNLYKARRRESASRTS